MSFSLNFFHHFVCYFRGLCIPLNQCASNYYITKAFPASLQSHKSTFSLPSTHIFLYFLSNTFSLLELYTVFTQNQWVYCCLMKLLFPTKSFLVFIIFSFFLVDHTYCVTFIKMILLLLNYLIIFLFRWHGL